MPPRLWSFRTSPFAGKARAAFHEKGVLVEVVEVHPAKRPPRLGELNPTGRVPTLELEDGTALRESLVICEWLEDTHPDPPLWPADPDLRGWARGWARFVDDNPVRDFFLGMRKLAFGREPDDPEDITERLHSRLPEHWTKLEGALALHRGPWLCGEQFTFADLCALPLAVRLPEWGPQRAPVLGEHPLTAAWLDALRARPSAFAIDEKGATAS